MTKEQYNDLKLVIELDGRCPPSLCPSCFILQKCKNILYDLNDYNNFYSLIVAKAKNIINKEKMRKLKKCISQINNKKYSKI